MITDDQLEQQRTKGSSAQLSCVSAQFVISLQSTTKQKAAQGLLGGVLSFIEWIDVRISVLSIFK